ncbi:MAG: Ldh family oxidoreductase [Dehalococcoidia bacterium]|nr:Ldh family oxidoreductase [Dehalococcoidia bacterium]
MAADPRPRFAAPDLRRFTADVLTTYGVPPEDAALGAEVLIDADLAGIESHGIAHLPWHPGYAPGFDRGIVNPAPAIAIVRDSPVAATWDADGGMGIIAGRKAMDAAIAKARATGIGMVAVRNGRHFGAAGYYAHLAAKQDMVGMAMCNVPPIANAAGGLERVFGTNPIAMAAPVEGSHAFLLDMATTAVAAGKLEIATRQGKPIPPGWAVDATGMSTPDPTILRQGGALLPLGSRLDTSSYKGYGLGLMVDILTGVLSGTGSGLFLDRAILAQGFWFAAWRIDAFRDPIEFKAEMRRMVDHIRATTPEPGVERVLIPGDPEAFARADREAHGIPLDGETIDLLGALGAKCGVPFPAPVG